MAEGYNSGEIARLLDMSKFGIHDRQKAIYRALGAKSGTHAVAIAIRLGFIK